MTVVAAALFVCLGTPCAITGATVHVGDGTVLTEATVLVENGRIAAVGSAVAVPEGTAVIDGRGRHLTPGLIESRSQVGLSEVGLEPLASDDSAEGLTITPAFDVADGYNPFSVWIPITREEGVTAHVVAPRGGLIAGIARFAWLTGDLDGAPDRSRPLALFADVTSGVSEDPRFGGARGMLWLTLREVFRDARFLRRHGRDYDRGASRKLALDPVHLEALYPVLDGKVPFVVRADRVSDILAAIAFARREGIRLVLSGAREGWRVAERIAAAKVPVILNPAEQRPTTFDAVAARDDNPALLDRAGVRLILSAGDWSHNIRRLRQVAGIAVSYGLPHERAIEAVTSAPAEVFGVEGTGRVAPGYRADLVLWSGDPLELSTVAEHVFIGGVERPMDNRQRRLVQRYLDRRPGGAAEAAAGAEAERGGASAAR
ncbi:MAG: amidohydrolase [Deltaproteobacteria bacterium]|nr:MAG: amidohydrolase [Deltaproteobacteria bacterium]